MSLLLYDTMIRWARCDGPNHCRHWRPISGLGRCLVSFVGVECYWRSEYHAVGCSEEEGRGRALVLYKRDKLRIFYIIYYIACVVRLRRRGRVVFCTSTVR
ncbi:hypothetical protein B9Z19DRAFT_1074124 [Tuber borchii]|uniref:Uncharacterized protein n=1 Tax=Tuber borchii TaxID=42251 RepID=A0A2T7A527_TUBBO|nr:hypothetical protein B9Z19DRAFT_1074124 [Tuber borchii]